jgi:hypothetical protein
MLFILYKLQDNPDYALLSELCYLLDGANLTRLLAYFEGKTVTFPTADELSVLTAALLLYQYVMVDGMSLTEAQGKLNNVTPKKKEQATELFLQIVPIMKQYNVDRGKFKYVKSRKRKKN